jgi:GNAT superfamily N-acetyltransferase
MLTFQTKRKGTKFTTYAFEGRKGVGKVVLVICVYDQNTAAIMDLFVRPEFRRKGYGTSLVENAISCAFAFPNIERVLIQDASEHGETGKIARRLGFVIYNNPAKGWLLERKPLKSNKTGGTL